MNSIAARVGVLAAILFSYSSALKAVTITVSTDPTVVPVSYVEPTEWDIMPNTTIPILDGTNQIGTARLVETPSLDLIAVTNSASPERTKAQQLAAIQAKTESNSNKLTRIERISIDLQQVNAQIEGTNWVDVVLTGISTTAGTWSNANQRATITAIKTALQATKDREQNLKVAVRNLMQATEKVRKEIEP